MTATTDLARSVSAETHDTIPVHGIVDIIDGRGYLRTAGYRRSPADIPLTPSQIRQHGLRKGDQIEGTAAPQAQASGSRNGKNARDAREHRLAGVTSVSGLPPEEARLAPALRRAHPDLPQRAAPSRSRRHLRHRADHRPGLPHRQGPARPDRRAAQGRQDHGPQDHRARDRHRLPRRAPDDGARRRAARGGHRPAALRARRGRLLDLRPVPRRPRPRRGNRHRARQAAGRARPGRRRAARLADPARPGLQPGRPGQQPHAVRRCRGLGAPAAPPVPRRGALPGGRRLR